jgi:hypothetical protein
MDLAIQHERLTPAWFRDWLLHATRLRPGTRMPQFWWRLDDVDRTEVDAVRSWLSLGPEAPVPNGFPVRGNELVLDPIDGPRLHGAFLGGLSARCLAVGSPERVHYAYDFAHCYLAWLWRGAFVDADGTWTGRAGKLLKPLGQQHVVLDDLRLGDGAGDRSRRALGWRRDADGYPVFRTRVGTAEFEDHPRPRLADGGSELVRTLRCVGGTLRVAFGTGGPVQILADGRPAAGEHELAAGKQLELVYRW